jgi:hypothetical protein
MLWRRKTTDLIPRLTASRHEPGTRPSLAFMKLCENRRNGEAMGTRNIIAILDRRLFRTDHGGTIAIRSNLTTVLSKNQPDFNIST